MNLVQAAMERRRLDRARIEQLETALTWMLDNWTSPALRAADIDELRSLVSKGSDSTGGSDG